MEHSLWNELTLKTQQRFLETLPRDVNTILDVGAGAGAHSAWFARRGFQPTAVDFFPERFEHHDEIEFLGSIEPLLATGRTFDAVFASHVLEHCPDMRSVLRDWRRLVRDGGYLIVVVPSYVPNACNGHWTTGWNIAQLAVLLVALAFDCREATFFDISGNVCGWGRKASFAELGDFYLDPALPYLPAGLRQRYYVDESGNPQLPGNMTAAFPDGRTEP